MLKPNICKLDYGIIFQEITDAKSIIRELRRIENDILKILKKELIYSY